MCTRYYVELSPELRPYIETASRSSLKRQMVSKLGKKFKETGEIRPADMATVIAPDKAGKKTSFPMVWGYHVEGLGRPVVNARIETAKEKKLFKEDWSRHRCIIPASYYFEWEHDARPDGKTVRGDKYAIQPGNAAVTYLAGLYRIEEERGFYYPVFTILTREPGDAVSRIHDRMPVILPEDVIADWVNPAGNPDQIANKALTDMVCEKV